MEYMFMFPCSSSGVLMKGTSSGEWINIYKGIDVFRAMLVTITQK